MSFFYELCIEHSVKLSQVVLLLSALPLLEYKSHLNRMVKLVIAVVFVSMFLFWCWLVFLTGNALTNLAIVITGAVFLGYVKMNAMGNHWPFLKKSK